MTLDLTAGSYDAQRGREKATKDVIQAEAVQVILPRGTECNGQNRVLINLKSTFLQLGDNNSIINMNFDTNNEAVFDFLSTAPKSPDKSQTALRVLGSTADNSASDEPKLIELGNETERINIRAKVVQIILPSQTPNKNSDNTPTMLDLEVKEVSSVAQLGARNELYLRRQSKAPSDDSSDPESTRACLRVIRKPKSPLSGVRGKRHSVELGYDVRNTPDSLKYKIETDVECKRGEVLARTSRVCRWELADWKPNERYAKFWFRFYESNAKYTLTFSLWQRVPTESVEEDCGKQRVDAITVNLQTGAAKTQARKVSQTASTNNYDPSRKPKIQRIKNPSSTGAKLSGADVQALGERFDQIMQVLVPLRDDGEWQKFDDKAETLLQEYTDADTQAIVHLERAVTASYRSENMRAEQIFREQAWRCVLAASDPLVPLLKGRAFCYLAGIYRRAEKLESAEKLLRSSKEVLEGSEHPLDLALLAYEEGSLQLCFMESASCALKQRMFKVAMEQFDRCVKLREQMRENEHNIYNLKHQFAVMKKAMLLLSSGTKRFRNKCVDENSIQEATRCLDSIQRLMRLKLAQAQYCLVRADQCVCQHCYEAAESFSLEAWGLSRMCGFDTFETAKQQLKFIRQIRSQPNMCRES